MARFQEMFLLMVPGWLVLTITTRCYVSGFVVDVPLSIRRTPGITVPRTCPPMLTTLYMSETDNTTSEKASLPFFLDPNTKGGVLVLMAALFFATWLGYQFVVNVLGYDEIDAGISVGMGFTVISTLAWISTYLFRVATKDMTYVCILVHAVFF